MPFPLLLPLFPAGLLVAEEAVDVQGAVLAVEQDDQCEGQRGHAHRHHDAGEDERLGQGVDHTRGIGAADTYGGNSPVQVTEGYEEEENRCFHDVQADQLLDDVAPHDNRVEAYAEEEHGRDIVVIMEQPQSLPPP